MNRERTDEIARRLEVVVPGVDAVVIQGGINDLVQGRELDVIAANIRQMVVRSAEFVSRVAVADVLPWNNGYPEHDVPIRRLNELIHALASDEDVTLLPFFATLEDLECAGRMRREWTNDGNHPSLEGHRRLGDLVSQVPWSKQWDPPSAPTID